VENREGKNTPMLCNGILGDKTGVTNWSRSQSRIFLVLAFINALNEDGKRNEHLYKITMLAQAQYNRRDMCSSFHNVHKFFETFSLSNNTGYSRTCNKCIPFATYAWL